MSEDKGFVLKEKNDALGKATGGKADTHAEAPLPTLDFATFIMSLNASALVNIGMIDDPVTGKKMKNLVLGKQTIDIIAMLEEKTKGNLTVDEEKLLKGMLYDLRIAFVKHSG